ncbi:hypothetical protein [Anaerovibrio sp. RM50]|uniref:hypothetical protein n=1 Tax=Anaerovibrio sp. RM50 TaxID=1200557 RepID=UPI000483776B|nr:hypothetical protein [Anaerovibrio sp. RM50]
MVKEILDLIKYIFGQFIQITDGEDKAETSQDKEKPPPLYDTTDYDTICQDDEYYIEEGLPYEYVHTGKYFYGNEHTKFYAFSEKVDTGVYFCSCQRRAIKNNLAICDRFFYPSHHVSGDPLFGLLNEMRFPACINKIIEDNHCNNGDEIFSLLRFKDGLCHLCNQVTPTEDYTEYVYASKFEKKYGQYLQAGLHDLGIGRYFDTGTVYFIKELMPDDVKSILLPPMSEILSDIKLSNSLSNDELARVQRLLDYIDKMPEPDRTIIMYQQSDYAKPFGDKYIIDENGRVYLTKALRKRFLEVKSAVVSEIKTAFKVKRWVNESILTNYVMDIFTDKTIFTHYRPAILEGLELDIFIKELNLGIEYQGVQHEKAIKVWGGEEGLKIRKEHDERKARLCKENGIKLVYFWYSEDISKDFVKEKLEKYIGSD